jgi:hypothetical protein
MRIPIVLTLASSLAATAGCRKDEATANPDDGDDENLLGIDAGAKPRKQGSKVSLGCIQDPADPDCAEVLGAVPSGDGEIEFTGDACRNNLCNGHGACELDPEGFVSCVCDDGAGGEKCDRSKR